MIKKDLARWEVLPLSMFGRIETVKMNILPRLLFIFQSIIFPVWVPVLAFNTLEKFISKFVWQNKRPRIRLKILMSNKDRGVWTFLILDTIIGLLILGLSLLGLMSIRRKNGSALNRIHFLEFLWKFCHLWVGKRKREWRKIYGSYNTQSKFGFFRYVQFISFMFTCFGNVLKYKCIGRGLKREVSKVLGCDVPMHPGFFLLHGFPPDLLSKSHLFVLHILLMAARKISS